jgi:hypothetical protein
VRNALVLAAVAAVALVAAWDALRDQPPTLAELGVSGRLVYSDERCRRLVVELPSGRLDATQRTRGCSVFSQAGNLGIERGTVAWFAFLGGTTTLLSRERLAELFGEGSRALRASWLGDQRYAAIVESPLRRGPRLVLFERDRLLAELLQLPSGFADLRSSPGGAYLAVADPRGGLAAYDRNGRAMPVPSGGRAIAWSPDERFAAIVLADEIAVVPVAGGREARLKLSARDVDWRA